MSALANRPCPGGTGEKIKSCPCCRDIQAELEKVGKAIEGHQRLAAKNILDGLLKKYPDRPSLLSLKTIILSELRKETELVAAVEEFYNAHPSNPLALNQKVRLLLAEPDLGPAIRLFQKGLASLGDHGEEYFARTASLIGLRTAERGNLIAAIAHFVLYETLADDPEPEVLLMALRLRQDDERSLLLRQPIQLSRRTTDGEWAKTFDTALAYAIRSRWLEALAILDTIDHHADAEPAILRNRAYFEALVDRREESAQTWRRLAAHPGADADQAIFATAMAETLGRPTDVATIRFARWAVGSPEAVIERLAADERLIRTPEPEGPEEADERRPLATFLVFDRPLVPPTDEQRMALTVHDLPRRLGGVAIFGRSTDDQPCLALTSYPSLGEANAASLVREIVGDGLGELQDERDGSPMSLLRLATDPGLLGVPPMVRSDYLVKQGQWGREGITDVLPAVPLPSLGGKTLTEAAATLTGDGSDRSETRVAVEAVLLELTAMVATRPEVQAVGELRQKLGLPLRPALTRETVDVDHMLLTDVPRLDLPSWGDDDIARLLHRIVSYGYTAGLEAVLAEARQRDGLRANEGVVSGLLHLASADPAADETERLLEDALAGADAGTFPRGVVRVSQARAALDRLDMETLVSLLQEIQSQYQDDARVMLPFQGLIEEIQRMRPAGPDDGLDRSERAPAPAAPASPAGGSSGSSLILDPTAASQPASSGSSSGLWLPGSD